MGTRDSTVAELGEDRLILLPNLSQYALVCNGCKLSSILSFLLVLTLTHLSHGVMCYYDWNRYIKLTEDMLEYDQAGTIVDVQSYVTNQATPAL